MSHVADKKSSGLAVASLSLGILGIILAPLALPAIITGHIAHNRAGRSPERFGGRRMAIAGFVLGYLSIVLLSATMLLVVKLRAAERRQVLADLKAKRLQAETQASSVQRHCIDLRSWTNSPFNDIWPGGQKAKDNNLGDFIPGQNFYGGIPFDAQGIVLLAGKKSLEFGRKFPTEVNGIKIGRKCAKVHLLHGGSFVQAVPQGAAIARFSLKYADGSEKKFDIVAGEHVLDWWGAIEQKPKDPETELAWTGRNPNIKRRAPNLALRLYKSSFANPAPDLEVVSLNYISLLTDASPFLIGVTVE